jgi:3'(2'), 5'-bisphosphate nucleotidase
MVCDEGAHFVNDFSHFERMSMELPVIDTQAIIGISQKAAQVILDIYYTEFEVTRKDDFTPLTKADAASNEIIVTALGKLYPDVPVISEEGRQVSFAQRRQWPLLWLVDPLDGTKEFINRNGEFTINIALIAHARPVWGMVLAPVSGDAYYASERCGVKRLRKGSIEVVHASRQTTQLTIATSRSHLSPQVGKYVMKLRTRFEKVDFISTGSALKFCLIAEGRAHLYPRFGTTMEWDTAAGQIIVEEAGGAVVDMSSHAPLHYNKADLHNPAFMAIGPALLGQLPTL